MSTVPAAPRSREEDDDLTWEEFAQVFVVWEDLYDKDFSKLTARKWYDSLTPEIGRELFKVAANWWIEHRKWMPKIPEFKKVAEKIQRAQRKIEEKERAEARAEAEKRRLEREARRALPDPVRKGRKVARAVSEGELDIGAAFGRQIPADVEESYSKADSVEE